MARPITVKNAQSAYLYLSAPRGAVLGSRYGEDSSECALYAVAWLLYVIEDNAEWSRERADAAMSWVINDSAELEDLMPGGALRDYYHQVVAITNDQPADLSTVAYFIYQGKGQRGVEAWAERFHPELEWTHCEPCEALEPIHDGRCLICDSPRLPAEPSAHHPGAAQ